MSEPFPAGITAPLEWINGVMSLAPHLHIDWVKHEILSRMREFFQRSGAWRDWVGPLTMDPTTPYYSIELSDYKAELVQILGGYRLSDKVVLQNVNDADPVAHQRLSTVGQPLYFYRTPEGLAAIFPMLPDASCYEQVMLYVTMIPIDLCVPEWIKLRHYDAIKWGVQASIYLTPGLNYKPDLGHRFERKFRAAMSGATRDVLASGTAAPQTVPVPQIVQGSQRFRASSMAVR